MDTAMRDLDQLRERGDEGTGRKLTVVALGTLVVVAAVFAMGILVGSDRTAPPPASSDPLAQLDRAAGAVPPPLKPRTTPDTDVRAEELSFPSALTTDPLVEAAVRAAAREHAALATAAEGQAADSAARPDEAATRSIRLDPSALPAGASASGHGERLERVAQHDKLVAAALPRASDKPQASSGRPGKYTLQVVSYETQQNADDFAEALKGRGHSAFVVAADVPGRGRYYRVRIGPFEKRPEALRYQSEFERDERMHTLVVQRRTTDD